jgi:hypothetical protein
MNLLALKLTLTPVLIAAATLAARWWGPIIGGWFSGLPLTSGPVSVFLALEQGREFAAVAARGSILGLVGVAAFCVAYARVSSRSGPLKCLALGFSTYAVVTLATHQVDTGPWLTLLIVWAVLGASLWLMPRPPREPAEDAPPPWWDLPLRMVAATAMVLVITTAATALGPAWSGLLTPFPVFTSVLAAFAHKMQGPAAASRLQRGVIIGVFSFAAFFLVVALLVERSSLLATYASASAVAVAINTASLFAIRGEHGGAG